MVQTIILENEAPARLNVEELRQAVAAVAPGVELHYRKQISWTDPGDVIRVQPSKLVFKNVPDNITEQQVRNFVQNHNPQESDKEVRRKEIRESFKNNPAGKWIIQQLNDIKARLDALEGQ